MGLLHEGQSIRGTYEVERFLGEGAFAEVYRVKHRFLGRQAMKVFKIIGMTIEETEQMLGEAIILSRIGHPNIIRVFDANVADTSMELRGFFTMEYVAGGSLEQYWRSYGQRSFQWRQRLNSCARCVAVLLLPIVRHPLLSTATSSRRTFWSDMILVGYVHE